MTDYPSSDDASPLRIRIFKPCVKHETDTTPATVTYEEISEPPHLTIPADDAVKTYTDLRKRRYLADRLPYNNIVQQFFDEQPNTRLVLAFQGDRLLGGGRFIRKAPGDGFNLHFQNSRFNQDVVGLLDEAGISLNDINVIDAGGVVGLEQGGLTSFATPSLLIQRKMTELAAEHPNISVSTVAARNARSVARTVRDVPHMHTIIYPETTIGDAKVNLFIFTNIDAVGQAMEQQIKQHKAMSPAQMLYKRQHGASYSQSVKPPPVEPDENHSSRQR